MPDIEDGRPEDPFAYARERVLVEELAVVARRVEGLSRQLARADRVSAQLRTDLEALRREVREGRVALPELDPTRGRTGGKFGALRRRLRAVRAHVAIVCPVYPGAGRAYGGEFVRARVRLYREAGVTVTVLVVPEGTVKRERFDHEGVTVIRTDARRLVATLRQKRPDVVAVHHLLPHVWGVLRPVRSEFRLAVWVHGFEARDWRELRSNFSHEELARNLPALEQANSARRATMSEAFGDADISFVFVSEFMRGVAERFAGRSASNGRVIPNVIDEEMFPYRPRRPEQRRSVLWVRSFSARNYANDLARDAVLALSRTPGFGDLRITIVGDGKYFEESVDPLRHLPNVTIRRGFVDTKTMKSLHDSHGIILVPTRWDSQGLTCGEAMSSGLVPVTNRVAAIPEFVPEEAGMLCPPDDAGALAEAVRDLQAAPDRYLQMSEAGSRAIQRRCGRAATIDRELELLAPAPGLFRRVFGG